MTDAMDCYCCAGLWPEGLAVRSYPDDSALRRTALFTRSVKSVVPRTSKADPPAGERREIHHRFAPRNDKARNVAEGDEKKRAKAKAKAHGHPSRRTRDK